MQLALLPNIVYRAQSLSWWLPMMRLTTKRTIRRRHLTFEVAAGTSVIRAVLALPGSNESEARSPPLFFKMGAHLPVKRCGEGLYSFS